MAERVVGASTYLYAKLSNGRAWWYEGNVNSGEQHTYVQYYP